MADRSKILLSRASMSHIIRLICVSSFLLAACAIDVQGKVEWNGICSGYRELGDSKVTLDNGLLYASVTKDGSFKIPDVPIGTYVLHVLSHDHAFDQFRIDVHENAEPEIRPYVAGTPLNPPSNVLLPYPISITPRQRLSYFIPHESFNLFGMLQSPMMLMMLFGAGMLLVTPYLLKNMDPESLEEFKEQRAKMARVQNAMATGDIKTGFSALISGKDDEPTTPASPKAPVSGKNKVNKGGKRR